jgi:hypothetical protein
MQSETPEDPFVGIVLDTETTGMTAGAMKSSNSA